MAIELVQLGRYVGNAQDFDRLFELEINSPKAPEKADEKFNELFLLLGEIVREPSPLADLYIAMMDLRTQVVYRDVNTNREYKWCNEYFSKAQNKELEALVMKFQEVAPVWAVELWKERI
jgi:hypothetical protein